MFLKNFQDVKNVKTTHTFSFLFVSYFPFCNTSHILKFSIHNNFYGKFLMKQSYILLTWFYYNARIKEKKSINFFAFPIKRKIFTNVKAPMAHKKNSKEQYKHQYFVFKIAFKCLIQEIHSWNFNNLLLFFLLNKRNFFYFETNLLFLKNFYKINQYRVFWFFSFYLIKIKTNKFFCKI